MTKAPNRLTSLLRRLGVAGPARVRAFSGTSASEMNQGTRAPGVWLLLVLVLGLLAFTAAPALAAGPEAPAPVVVESIKATSAAFHGELNPGKEGAVGTYELGTYEFLYKQSPTECEGGSKAPASPSISLGGGKEALPPQEVGGLEPHTEYTVCLLARNGNKGEATVGPHVTFKTATLPATPTTTEPATGITATEATLHGVLNPNATGPVEPGSSYEFLYRKSATECELAGKPENATPTTSAAGNAKEAAEATLTGLPPGTQYTFCLLASNGVGETAVGSPVTFTTPAAAPVPVGESAADVSASSATLNLEVNAGGTDTTYRLEYGTSTSYADNVEGDAGSLSGEATIGVHVQGLQPSTVYHYRFVVSNAVRQGVEGEDQTFTTQRGGSELGLLDGRQWELVTPPKKQGALFYALNRSHIFGGSPTDPFVAKASADGEAIVDLASQPSEVEPPGASNEVSVLSTRGSAGWSSEVIAPPHEQATGPSVGSGSEYHLFSEDLSRGIVDLFGNGFTPLSPEATESTPYLRTDFLNGNVTEHCRASCYQPLVTRADTREGVKFGEENEEGRCEVTPGEEFQVCGARFVDATPDLSHIILEAGTVVEGEQLTSTPNETSGFAGRTFYEWSGGQLQPLYLLPKSEGGVGVIASGVHIDGGHPNGVYEETAAETLATETTATRTPGTPMSDDGSVFFPYRGHLYLHDFAKDESFRLDVAQGVAEPSQDEASILYAANDGSKFFFTDPQRLTTAAGGGIYECRVVEVAGSPKCELELTGLSGGSLIGGSSDASYLYFVGAGERLIVDHYENGKWTTGEGPVVSSTDGATGLLAHEDQAPVYRVSPDGRFVAFMSDHDLTGYDNRDAISGQPDIEVYLYDAITNKLVCASCNPTGARPRGTTFFNNGALVGGVFLGSEPWTAASLPPWTNSLYGPEGELYQPRFLSDTGRLFFNSVEALVPQDVNGTQDVYEYEPVGVGSCSTSSVTFGERSGGCVGLVSSGSSPDESAFMDASETGGDVFFITTAKLAPADYDDALDVYDAHECTTAVPCFASEPVSPPACSTGDACKAAPTLQPTIFGAPPSATFSGAGNLSPPPGGRGSNPPKVTKKTVNCKKGFVKNKQGKCMKKPKKKKTKAKKSKRSASENRRTK